MEPCVPSDSGGIQSLRAGLPVVTARVVVVRLHPISQTGCLITNHEVCNDGTRLDDDQIVVPSPDSATHRIKEKSRHDASISGKEGAPAIARVVRASFQ
uniref:Uncharacterized protein n=1 Tax=Hyaloperonospora arabidopsidis (strain Emoy2) TaxID=559515 RepID=M4BH01_HYAAE